MSERVFDGLARVTQAPPQGMVTLKGDLGAVDLKNAATGLTGLDFPGLGEAKCVGEKGLCWMAPDELLLILPHAEADKAVETIDRALAGTHYLAANVSDARALFFLEGPHAREVLAKLTPADLDPARFSTGQFRRTRIAQVPAAFWMRDAETFEIIAFRSVADYVFDVLLAAANPGAAVDYF